MDSQQLRRQAAALAVAGAALQRGRPAIPIIALLSGIFPEYPK